MSLSNQAYRTQLFVESLEDRIVPAVPGMPPPPMPTPPDLYFAVEEAGGDQVRIYGNVSDEEPSSVAVQFSGVASGQVTPDEYGSFELTTTASGMGTVTGVATDSDGLSTEVETYFESLAPSVSFMVEQTGPGEITISGSISDEQLAGQIVIFTGVVLGNTETDEWGNFSVVTSASQAGDITATVTDPWGLESDPFTTELFNDAPEITYFDAIDHGQNVWTFEGYVSDEYAYGLTVRLGGIPSLEGVTVTVDMFGYFSINVTLDPGEFGNVWAETTDWYWADSNTALDFVD